MNNLVAKAFKTLDRVFAVGDPISETDIHPEGHLTFEHWLSRGFIKGSATAAPVKAASISGSELNPD